MPSSPIAYAGTINNVCPVLRNCQWPLTMLLATVSRYDCHVSHVLCHRAIMVPSSAHLCTSALQESGCTKLGFAQVPNDATCAGLMTGLGVPAWVPEINAWTYNMPVAALQDCHSCLTFICRDTGAWVGPPTFSRHCCHDHKPR